MGYNKEKNIVHKWYKQLNRVESNEIKRLCNLVGCPEARIPAWGCLDDAVVYTVISQMLSLKAAHSISNKVYQQFGTSKNLLKHISSIKIEKPLHGISIKKQKSLFCWANSPQRKNNTKIKVQTRLDVYDTFYDIWGLGEWSIDMLGIFYFCIPNIWPESDLGIMKFSDKYFHGRKPRSINGLETITALCIWQGIDNKIF